MLMPHNQPIFAELVDALHRYKRVCFRHGTGLGKSFILFELCLALAKGRKVLYVLPKWAIAEMVRSYKEYSALGVEITFRTYNWFKTERDLSEYDFVVFDEVHHIASGTYGQNALRSKTNGKILGMTATTKRDDKIDVTKYFDTTVEGLSTFDAIRQGLIPPFEYLVCTDDLAERIEKGKREEDYRKRVMFEESLPLLSKVIAKNPRERWMCFFSDIKTLLNNEDHVRSLFPDDYTLAKITSKHSGAITDVMQHDKTVILCVDKLLEGVHVPDTQGIILFRNVRSLTVFQQILGRVVHVGSTKPPIILDCTETAIKLLAKLMNEDNPPMLPTGGNFPPSKKPILYCSLNNTEHFDLMKLLVLAQTRLNEWTSEELTLLKDNYSILGNKALQRLLPRHTGGSIYKKATEMGLVSAFATLEWSKEEEAILRRGIEKGLSYKDIASSIPGRTVHAVRSRAMSMGLKKGKQWSKEEMEWLRENYNTLSYDEMAQKLNTTFSTVRNMCKKLGLKKDPQSVWTKELEEYLRDHYEAMDTKVIADTVGVTPACVNAKARSLGLTKGRVWTEGMKDYLKKNYHTLRAADIAKKLGLATSSVNAKARKLGLTKSNLWTAEMEDILRNEYNNKTSEQLGEMLHVKPAAIRQKASQLGIRKRKKSA